MQRFQAKNAKQLDICLKMLYAEKMDAVIVKTVENQKRKIEYRIEADVEEDRYSELLERYRILIS